MSKQSASSKSIRHSFDKPTQSSVNKQQQSSSKPKNEPLFLNPSIRKSSSAYSGKGTSHSSSQNLSQNRAPESITKSYENFKNSDYYKSHKTFEKSPGNYEKIQWDDIHAQMLEDSKKLPHEHQSLLTVCRYCFKKHEHSDCAKCHQNYLKHFSTKHQYLKKKSSLQSRSSQSDISQGDISQSNKSQSNKSQSNKSQSNKSQTISSKRISSPKKSTSHAVSSKKHISQKKQSPTNIISIKPSFQRTRPLSERKYSKYLLSSHRSQKHEIKQNIIPPAPKITVTSSLPRKKRSSAVIKAETLQHVFLNKKQISPIKQEIIRRAAERELFRRAKRRFVRHATESRALKKKRSSSSSSHINKKRRNSNKSSSAGKIPSPVKKQEEFAEPLFRVGKPTTQSSKRNVRLHSIRLNSPKHSSSLFSGIPSNLPSQYRAAIKQKQVEDKIMQRRQNKRKTQTEKRRNMNEQRRQIRQSKKMEREKQQQYEKQSIERERQRKLGQQQIDEVKSLWDDYVDIFHKVIETPHPFMHSGPGYKPSRGGNLRYEEIYGKYSELFQKPYIKEYHELEHLYKSIPKREPEFVSTLSFVDKLKNNLYNATRYLMEIDQKFLVIENLQYKLPHVKWIPNSLETSEYRQLQRHFQDLKKHVYGIYEAKRINDKYKVVEFLKIIYDLSLAHILLLSREDKRAIPVLNKIDAYVNKFK